MPIDNINIFPLYIKIFSIEITDEIEKMIIALEGWILSQVSVPMNAMAELYNSFYYL